METGKMSLRVERARQKDRVMSKPNGIDIEK